MTSIHFPRVHPGDLISSELLNSVLTQIEKIQDEIDALSGGNTDAPVIVGLVPADQLAAPAELLILGRNFAVPANLNRVTLDDVVLTGFRPGSTDTRLVLSVPAGIPGLPRTMTLRVATVKGSSLATIRVVPGQLPIGGKPVVKHTTVGAGKLTAGQLIPLTFELTGDDLLQPEQFKLELALSWADPAGTEDKWVVKLAGVDGDGTVTVRPGESSTVVAQVTVPRDVKSVIATLQATSVHNSPESDSASLPVVLTVGSAPPGADAGVRFGDFGAPGLSIQYPLIDGIRGARVKYDTGTILKMNVEYTEAGRFQWEISIANPGQLWEVTQLSEPLRTVDGPSADILAFPIRLKAHGPADDETRTATIKATRKDPDGAQRVSATSFPVAGFAP